MGLIVHQCWHSAHCCLVEVWKEVWSKKSDIQTEGFSYLLSLYCFAYYRLVCHVLFASDFSSRILECFALCFLHSLIVHCSMLCAFVVRCFWTSLSVITLPVGRTVFLSVFDCHFVGSFTYVHMFCTVDCSVCLILVCTPNDRNITVVIFI